MCIVIITTPYTCYWICPISFIKIPFYCHCWIRRCRMFCWHICRITSYCCCTYFTITSIPFIMFWAFTMKTSKHIHIFRHIYQINRISILIYPASKHISSIFSWIYIRIYSFFSRHYCYPLQWIIVLWISTLIIKAYSHS